MDKTERAWAIWRLLPPAHQAVTASPTSDFVAALDADHGVGTWRAYVLQSSDLLLNVMSTRVTVAANVTKLEG
jgi:hypothetical protein